MAQQPRFTIFLTPGQALGAYAITSIFRTVGIVFAIKWLLKSYYYHYIHAAGAAGIPTHRNIPHTRFPTGHTIFPRYWACYSCH